MQRRYALIGLAFVLILIAKPILATEQDIQQCKLSGLDEKVIDELKGQKFVELFKRDNYYSFSLKALAPHLMKDQILFWQEYVNCYTYKKKSPGDWAECLRPRLKKYETLLLDSTLKCRKSEL